MTKLLKHINSFWIIWLFILICSCASSKPTVGDIVKVPGPDESVLIFHRVSFQTLGPAVVIYINGVEQFSLKGKQTARIVVPNGVHELSGLKFKRNNRPIPRKISVNSEEIRFSVQAVAMEGANAINIDFIENRRKNYNAYKESL